MNAIHTLRPWIALVGVILVIWTLRMASAALMPLFLALFVIVLAWPLQRRLETRLPRWISLGVTILIIWLVMALVGGAVWLCVNNVAAQSDVYQARFEALIGEMQRLLYRFHVTVGFQQGNLDKVVEWIVDFMGGFAKHMYDVLGVLVLVFALVVLGLLEVRSFYHKVQTRLRQDVADKLIDAANNTAAHIQRFAWTRTLTSALTGVLTGLFTWMIGLDFPVVWGFTAFVLNYVPVLGSIIAVIPPTLIALILPEAAWRAPLTLGGLTLMQFIVGNYLDPLLQGHFLSLSPLVLFYCILVWSWIWGIPGAFLAVPLTIGIVIVCQHFDNAKWIADLLAQESS